MALSKHYRNPAALAFACTHGGCDAGPGIDCLGDRQASDQRYQHWMHKERLALLDLVSRQLRMPGPESSEEWEDRANQIRAAVSQ
jgi:hypothetical protein